MSGVGEGCRALAVDSSGSIYKVLQYMVLFFFSSRRRHTRCLSDWSSDVCSSDLVTDIQLHPTGNRVAECTALSLSGKTLHVKARHFVLACGGLETTRLLLVSRSLRSEERRVGKEGRSTVSPGTAREQVGRRARPR